MAREASEVQKEFANGLTDLTVNNKSLINMFTMLADDNIAYADVIVETIENRLKSAKNDHKLVVLYLIDSIVKNVGQVYKELFAKNIVVCFCNVFERVDEKTRIQMYKLRHTWMEVFSATKLYALDCKIHTLDPAWPIVPIPSKSNIFVNPKFLLNSNTTTPQKTEKTVPTSQPTKLSVIDDENTLLMKKDLVDKQKKLLELQQRKLELELLQTKVQIEAQQKQLTEKTLRAKKVQVAKTLLKPEAARELEETVDKQQPLIGSIITTTANTMNIFPSNEVPTDPRLARGAKATQKLQERVQVTEKLHTEPELKEKSKSKSQSPPHSKAAIVPQFSPEPFDNMNGTDSPKDVDLRQLNTSNKRSSLSSKETEVSKKMKIDISDDLFGMEDVDLRSTTVSTAPVKKVQSTPPTAPPPPKISDKQSSKLESLRAKLANVPTMKTSQTSTVAPSNDIDLRSDKLTALTLTELIAQASEKLKEGIITADEMSTMVQQFMMNKEREKLQEAQKKDVLNVDLQPISDDELVDFSHSDESTSTSSAETPRERSVEKPITTVDSDNKNQNGDEKVKLFERRKRDRRPWHNRYDTEMWSDDAKKAKVLTEITNIKEHRYRIKCPPLISVHTTRNLHHPNKMLLDFITRDTMRTITIDGLPREIRYYGDTAVIFLNWDDPRQITFHNGARRVTFNKNESFLLPFNDPFIEVSINGSLHRVRLGAPTRELFIDNKWYECVFGGSEFLIELNGTMTSVLLDGPPPQVKISDHRRTDLVIAKINLIVDAQKVIPLFLDAKPQKAEIGGRIFTFRFANSLKTVLINEMPFQFEFGGLPRPISVGNKKHFIRFSVLPTGIEPGCVRIINMEEWLTDTRNVPYANPNATPISGANGSQFTNQNKSNMDDILSSAVSSSMAPSISGCYNIGNNDPSAVVCKSDTTTTTIKPLVTIADPQPQQKPHSPLLSQPMPASVTQAFPNLANVNISQLYQKLVATGIIPQSSNNRPASADSNSASDDDIIPQKSRREADLEALPKNEWIQEVSLVKRNTLKIRNASFINSLHTGMQCSSCGIRFLPGESMKYSQHLDYHFHKNRTQRSLAKTPLNRRWFLTTDKWIENSLSDNLETKEKIWTEIPQPKKDVDDEKSRIAAQPSVPSNSTYYMTEQCSVCYDKFDEFYHEDEEEWHLRNALRIDNELYHPICYEDHLKSMAKLMKPKTAESHDSNDLVIDSDKEESVDEDISVVLIAEVKKDVSNYDVVEVDDDDDDDQDEDNNVSTDIKLENNKEEIIEFDCTKIKTEPGLEAEIEEPIQINEGRFEDEGFKRMDVEYSFDGYEVPKAITNTISTTGLKITVSKSLLSNSRQSIANKATNSTKNVTESVDDIIIEKEVPYKRPDLKPVSVKESLQGIDLKVCPVVEKGHEETCLCSIM